MSDTLFNMADNGVPFEARRAPANGRAYQRLIREREAEADPRICPWRVSDCVVRPITTVAARRIIWRYEWLGSLGGDLVSACYGLIAPDGAILGVTVFGIPANPHSSDVCGPDRRHDAICLKRGACVHYAPNHAASYLISRAVKQAAHDHGWRIFYAYADPQAGEIGTVYQACNWLYIGHSRPVSLWKRPGSERPVHERNMPQAGLSTAQARNQGWVKLPPAPPKHRYVHFEGSRMERRGLLAQLRYEVLPYPKRAAEDVS